MHIDSDLEDPERVEANETTGLRSLCGRTVEGHGEHWSDAALVIA